MAGPGQREWKIIDHPEQGWVRASWTDQSFDPRLIEGPLIMRLTVAQAVVKFLTDHHLDPHLVSDAGPDEALVGDDHSGLCLEQHDQRIMHLWAPSRSLCRAAPAR
jgi:hypothetical protein